ncbi:MAG: hypothetical protein Q7U82_12905 [Gammaproteobacteria bacterium]|nr:hypothetical protein [Gammaproteobacteria bacterium]
MQQKLAQLLTAVENIAPSELIFMPDSDLRELERISARLSERIEMQRIWRGNEATTIPRSRHNATAQ